MYVVLCFNTDETDGLLFEDAFWSEDKTGAERIASQWMTDTHLAGTANSATILRLTDDGSTEVVMP
jgi:hypothetical protein